MVGRIDRNVAVIDRTFVEIVEHLERILDERGVRLDAVTSVNGESRRLERRAEDRPFAPVGGQRHGGIGTDVEAPELLDPLFETVDAVYRVVVLVISLLQHQPLDVFPARFGGLQRDGRGGGAFVLAAEREVEQRLLGFVDHPLLHRVEVEVEGRVALRFSGGCRLVGDILVAFYLIDREPLFGQRIPAVGGDGDEQLCRVEDRFVSEIPLLDFGEVDHLRQESRRAEAERVVELRAEVARREVRRDDRVALEKTRGDVFRLVLAALREPDESGAHLLVVRNEIASQRVVHRGAASERQRDRRKDRCRAEQQAEEFIGSLHRIGCNYRKSPQPRAIGIRAPVSRSHGRSPTRRDRPFRTPPPRRRHTP